MYLYNNLDSYDSRVQVLFKSHCHDHNKSVHTVSGKHLYDLYLFIYDNVMCYNIEGNYSRSEVNQVLIDVYSHIPHIFMDYFVNLFLKVKIIM